MDRKKRVAEFEREAEEERRFVREIADAFSFRFIGSEILDGRPVYVIDAQPIAGYKPRLKDARILPKFRFRAWIDQAERQWVKLDIECIETVSWGLFLARFHKGSRIQLEQTRINDEVWLPKHFAMRLDARIALLKNIDKEFDVTFRDYRKFRVDSIVRPLGEAPPAVR
jgi:hypothetical protein